MRRASFVCAAVAVAVHAGAAGSAGSVNVTVPGKANIFGAGSTTPPDPGGGGPGGGGVQDVVPRNGLAVSVR